MTFDEAMKEMLSGKTVCRMNYDPEYDETLLDEFSRDGSNVSLRKLRVTIGRDGKRWEKELYNTPACEAVKFYPEEITSDGWFVKTETHSAEEAFQAFREGKWIRHESQEDFIKRDAEDSNVYQKFCRYPSGSTEKEVCRFDMSWFTVKRLFTFDDGWIISDKETPT